MLNHQSKHNKERNIRRKLLSTWTKPTVHNIKINTKLYNLTLFKCVIQNPKKKKKKKKGKKINEMENIILWASKRKSNHVYLARRRGDRLSPGLITSL